MAAACGQRRAHTRIFHSPRSPAPSVALGGTLVVRTGRPEEVLPLLAHEMGATQFYYHEEACTEEVAVERSVRRVLTSAHVACSAFWGHTLVNPKALGYDITELPELFTTFRTKLERPGNSFKDACAPPRPLPPPARINSDGVRDRSRRDPREEQTHTDIDTDTRTHP